MRRISKLPIPPILAKKAATWLAAFRADPGSEQKKTKYRHAKIKKILRDETGWKCVYCESKIGHNTPGDVEHKVPTSKDPDLHFEWTNLTVACTECNRRKLDYYTVGNEFLDPYKDDVETWLIHLGPLVYWRPGLARAEISVRKLELDTGRRTALLDRKTEVLEKARSLLENIASAGDPLLKALREDELKQMCAFEAEYSAMVRTYVEQATAPPVPAQESQNTPQDPPSQHAPTNSPTPTLPTNP